MRNNLVDNFTLVLAAGIEGFVNFAGEQFYLESAASPVDVTFLDDSGGTLGKVSGVKTGFNVNFAGKGRIGSMRITSSIAQSIRLAVADGSINFNAITGTINAINAQATMLTNTTAVVGVAVGSVMGADSTRKTIIFAVDKDTISGRIAIGGSGVTFANAAIILDADTPAYIDTTCAAAQRYAIADVAAQTLRMEIGI